MKKIIIFTLCALLACALPIAAYAAETTAETTAAPMASAPEASVEEGLTEQEEALGTLLSKRFEEWVLPHLEEISVVITMILTLFYQIRKNRLLTKSMGTMNNNAVTIAEQSSDMMARALTGMENAALAVRSYEEKIEALLEAHRATAQDKERLESELARVKEYLRTATRANVEFANEFAELLGLANIPNYKKEEIGARHLAAVHSIKSAEEEALTHTEEVILNGKEDGAKA